MVISETYDFLYEDIPWKYFSSHFPKKNIVIFIHLYQMKNLSSHWGWSQVPYSLSIHQDHKGEG